jgi:hypothetical protein
VWTPDVSFAQLIHATSTGETIWDIQPCGGDGNSLCTLTRSCSNYDCGAVVSLSAAAVDGLRQGLATVLRPVKPSPDAGCSIEMGFIGMLTGRFVYTDAGEEVVVYGRYGSEDLPACVSSEQSAIRRDGGLDDDEMLVAGPFDGYFTVASYEAFEDQLEAYLQYCQSVVGTDNAGICGTGAQGEGFR